MTRSKEHPERSGVGFSEGLGRLLGPAFFILVCAAVYARMFFSVDLTDDAYYAALPWSFIHGHRPLIDEWAIHQLGALLIWPIFEAFHAFVGSNDGLILFQRHLHFIASLATALTVRRPMADLFGSRIAWPVSALVVAYVPFHIQALSYNTIAALAFMAGLFMLARAIQSGGGRSTFVTATLLFVISVFAYPPMALASALGLVLAVWFTRQLHGTEAGRRVVFTIGMAAAGAGLVVGVWLAITADLSTYGNLSALNEALDAQGGGLRKISALFKEVSLEATFMVALLFWLNGLLLVATSTWSAGITLAAVLVLGAAPFGLHALYVPFTEPFTSAPLYAVGLALVSPFLAQRVALDFEPAKQKTLWLLVGPSLLAGVVILWATANGLRNTPLGIQTAALVSLGCVAWLVDGRTGNTKIRHAAAFALIVLLVSFQLVQLWQNTYRNGPVSQLSARIESGPWMGIRTTPARKKLLALLTADLERYRGDAETIFVYDYLPAGYLLSDLRPMTHALWTFPDHCCQGTQAAREVYARRFSEPEGMPDLVLENRCLFIEDTVQLLMRPPGLAPDPVRERLSAPEYEVRTFRECYSILERVRP